MFNKTGIYSVVLPAAFLLILLAFPALIRAQFRNNGASIYIADSGSLSIKGPIYSDAAITGNGNLVLSGDSVQTLNMQGNPVNRLVVANSQRVILNSPLSIGHSIKFERGFLSAADYDITLSDSAVLKDYTENRFILTPGTGSLVKKQLGPAQLNGFEFPVGTSESAYNPLVIGNRGVADDFWVRARINDDPSGHFIQAGWQIGEIMPGGSILTLTGGWRGSDEPAGFLRNKCGIARQKPDMSWELPSSNIAEADNGNVYSRTRERINSVGFFSIADSSFANRAQLQLRVFLQGAYTGNNISPGLMKDQLRTSQAVPLTQPYNGGLYHHTGLQGGTEEISPLVLQHKPDSANDIVDWVFISLLNAGNPSEVLQTRSALLQRDGDVVDLDGQSPLSMPINEEGDYLVGIGHRNHLRIRTPDQSPLFLANNNTITEWDFSAGNGRAYQNPLIGSNEAMMAITQGTETRFCMIGGNTDGLTQVNSNARMVIYSGAGNDRNNILVYGLNGISTNTAQVTMYNYEDIGMYDLNMDGRIIYSREGNDPAVILEALGGNSAVAAREHY